MGAKVKVAGSQETKKTIRAGAGIMNPEPKKQRAFSHAEAVRRRWRSMARTMSNALVKVRLVGSVAVDSGQVVLCDPCCVLPCKRHDKVAPHDYDETWKARNGALRRTPRPFAHGVLSRSPHGDGLFPVFEMRDARTNEVVSLSVFFSTGEVA